MTGAMYAVQIMVDNQLMGEVNNGCTVTLELPAGHHEVEVSGGGLTRRATIRIVDEQTTYCQMYFSAWGILGGGLILTQGGRQNGPRWILWTMLVLLLVPLCMCGVVGLVTYWGGGKADQVPVEMTVVSKHVKPNPNSPHDWYILKLVDKQGNYKSVNLRDNILATKFLPEDLYYSVEIGQKYQVIFTGDKHNFVGLVPTIREHNRQFYERMKRKGD